MTKSITIYSTPTCVYCRATKDFFKEHNISYTEYNVAADSERVKEMVQKSGQMGVPVIIITNESGEEEVVVGFNKTRLKELLGIKS